MVDMTSFRGSVQQPQSSAFLPPIRAVESDRPWVWLSAAWRDMMAAPLVSFGYGALAVISSFVLVVGLALEGLEYLILPLAAGFMLLGPVFAVGLYESSRLMELGERPTLGRVAAAYQRNGMQVAGIGLVLMMALLAWIRVAFLIFALFYSSQPPAFDQLVDRIFFSAETIPFLLTGTVFGAVIAAGVFSIAVVSIPMLLDRDTDVFTAMATSVAVVRENVRPMMTWAFLVALFTSAGMVTGFLGMAIAFPLIGHASWHCYRDLVGRARQP
ncbi:DUF2189 domain-containing protein [Azospirillum doebereinerae]|uniref:DUF2189 domain-containing protein n=1 Tax=Azospirillum doebereinerae TaxID=92933 RepID=A0A3S1CGZ4_9PROT|nr:DUF2189 domain-containing protein [Azospirillum doebereinerae]MCG5243740.1 DUF2189 domain-containing protein [Azospirillum doebereinerae]RUQ70773.1 DUF2189 domain-containing protein [Azospirillum doebereinerae]